MELRSATDYLDALSLMDIVAESTAARGRMRLVKLLKACDS
jgi:hypothetical protein